MKVTTTNTPIGFDVTFHIGTIQDGIDFHDLVAIRVCQGPHRFLGDVYRRIRKSTLVDGSYDIPLVGKNVRTEHLEEK